MSVFNIYCLWNNFNCFLFLIMNYISINLNKSDFKECLSVWVFVCNAYVAQYSCQNTESPIAPHKENQYCVFHAHCSAECSAGREFEMGFEWSAQCSLLGVLPEVHPTRCFSNVLFKEHVRRCVLQMLFLVLCWMFCHCAVFNVLSSTFLRVLPAK